MTSTSLNKTLEYLGINVSSLKQSQIDSASKFLKQIGCFLVSIAVGNSESIGKHIPKEFRETEGVTKTLKEYLAPIQSLLLISYLFKINIEFSFKLILFDFFHFLFLVNF